ncbi:uncharacterized protein LOC120329937 [Styela clava]
MFGVQAKSILLMIAIITAICITIATADCSEKAEEGCTRGVIIIKKKKFSEWENGPLRLPNQVRDNQYLILDIPAFRWYDKPDGSSEETQYCSGHLELTGLPKTCDIAKNMTVIYSPYSVGCNVKTDFVRPDLTTKAETTNIVIHVQELPSLIRFKSWRSYNKPLTISYEYKQCDVINDDDNDPSDSDDDSTSDDEEMKNGATQCPNAKSREETEKPSNNTSLVILVAILGTSLIVTLIVITVMAQKLKALKNKLTDKTHQSSSPDAVMVVNDFYGEGDFQQSQQASQSTPDPTAVYAVVNKSRG